MPRLTKDAIALIQARLERENSAMQEYILLSLKGDPCATEIVVLDGEQHAFKLYGATRSCGGVVLHTVYRDNGTLSPRVYFLEDMTSLYKDSALHTDAWMLRDAIDTLYKERNRIVNGDED